MGVNDLFARVSAIEVSHYRTGWWNLRVSSRYGRRVTGLFTTYERGLVLRLL